MSWEAGERSVSPNKAYQSALAKCSELGIEVNFRKYGSSLNSWNCDVLKNGKIITNGKGKGIGVQSKSSALFEAIEHFIYESQDHTLLYCSELGSENLDSVLLNGASPDFSLILGGRSSKFSRIPMRSFDSIDRVLYFPAFLFYPNFVSSHKEENEIISQYGLLRYSTNNGTASGIDVAEAGLHALLEAVERDAIGIEMLRTVISKEPLPVRQIRLEGLPHSLVAVCNAACEEAHATLRLWDITSDITSPVILASLETENGKYFGSGASLTSEYAVERAILEAVQGYHNYSYMNSEAPLFGLTRWAETSLYQRCYLEAGHFGFRGGSILVEFDDIKSLCFAGFDIKDNLNNLAKHLSDQGFEPFWRTIIDDGIAVVQVSVPRFDRFHLVTQGVPVAPSARGRSHLSESKSESLAT